MVFHIRYQARVARWKEKLNSEALGSQARRALEGVSSFHQLGFGSGRGLRDSDRPCGNLFALPLLGGGEWKKVAVWLASRCT